MGRTLSVLMVIIFLIICYPVLAEFAASGDTDSSPQLVPEETPVSQAAEQGRASSNSTPQPDPVNQPQELPSRPKGVTPPDQSVEKPGQATPSHGEMPGPLLINKEHGLSPEYVPPDLTTPAIPFSFDEDLPKKLMVAPAARAVEDLFAAAEAAGIKLVGISAYRSYETQQAIFQRHVESLGSEEAERISAPPGHSEHQTGLAIDVSSSSVNYQLVEEFGDTLEGQWLAENASFYGFILRYPRNKESVTGYRYEPWHIRYVGVQFARAIAVNGLTIEEYSGNKMIARN